MNRQLAEAVVAAFRTGKNETARRRFEGFRDRDWARTRKWLHTSGMALYFLDRATRLGIEDVMPAQLVHELSVNVAENRVRTADLFEEFARLNSDFQRAGISYVNLKGFSLAPEAYADPALRYQLDLDFLVARRDAQRCVEALEKRGYRLASTFGESWEFRIGTPVEYTIREMYRVRSVKSIEIHLVPEIEEARAQACGSRISRMQLQVWNGFEFPALGDADKLLSQGRHLFRHFQSEWTRTGWIKEYAEAIRARSGNSAVWSEAVELIEARPEVRIGVALANLVTSRTFGVALPREFAASTVDALPPAVRVWMDRYEHDLAFAQFPGSKLYLLLQDVLQGDGQGWREKRRAKLLPTQLPSKVMLTSGGGLRMRRTAAVAQLRFIAKRVWFHLRAGLGYKLEAARWRRFVAGAGL
jgi:hypothetical protein